MRHVGVTGGTVLFFFLRVDIIAILAFKALGVMDARLVPLGRSLVAVGACRTEELLIVRDGFDIAVAARAGEIAVDGPFLKGLMTIEAILRINGSMKGGTKKEEDEPKNQRHRQDIYIEPKTGDISKDKKIVFFHHINCKKTVRF